VRCKARSAGQEMVRKKVKSSPMDIFGRGIKRAFFSKQGKKEKRPERRNQKKRTRPGNSTRWPSLGMTKRVNYYGHYKSGKRTKVNMFERGERLEIGREGKTNPG